MIDPSRPVDPNYVLTFDNLIKILAIVLRLQVSVKCMIITLYYYYDY